MRLEDRHSSGDEALTVIERLDDKERRARQGLVSRAVTIR